MAAKIFTQPSSHWLMVSYSTVVVHYSYLFSSTKQCVFLQAKWIKCATSLCMCVDRVPLHLTPLAKAFVVVFLECHGSECAHLNFKHKRRFIVSSYVAEVVTYAPGNGKTKNVLLWLAQPTPCALTALYFMDHWFTKTKLQIFTVVPAVMKSQLQRNHNLLTVGLYGTFSSCSLLCWLVCGMLSLSNN